MSAGSTDELLEQFLVEGRELVEAAANDLLALERDPADAARLDGAFRAVHTLKGSVAIFGFAPMGAALHAAEDLLDAIRSGALAARRDVLDALLEGIGASERWIEAIARTGALPADAAERGRALEAALRAPLAGAGLPARQADPVAAAPDWLPGLLRREAAALAPVHAAGAAATAVRYLPAADCFFLGDDPMATVRAVPGLLALHVALRGPPPPEGPDPFTCNLAIELLSAAPAEALRGVFRFAADQVEIAEVPPPEPLPGADAPAAPEAGRSLRVDAARIDALLDLAGELIVAKNGLAHLLARAAEGVDPALARELADGQAGIERLAEAMHRGLLRVRMVPLARSFRRFPRLMRDTAAALGKEVSFEMRGETVEADKTVVDGLFQPLLHLLRNAVDHGIEAPDARVAAGKPAAGRVLLAARKDGDGVVVEVSDDGRGLDLARLRREAGERGLLPEATAAALDDAAAADLVFLPGLTTAAAVSAVSGRGVGMDAVRDAVEALGGRIALRSAPGAGSTVRLTLPQGATITTVLLVRVGEDSFGVPTAAVTETVRLAADRILPIRRGEAFVLRDRTVPLLRLSALLSLPGAERPAGGVRVLVTGEGAARVGLEVDAFTGRADVLLRPLGGLLSGTPGLLGTALLGDGRVLLVLDLPGLLP
jgi:two-component system chemotaxis sensor kinase CheA